MGSYSSLPVIGTLLSELGVMDRDGLFALNMADVVSHPDINKAKLTAISELMRAEKSSVSSNVVPLNNVQDLFQRCSPYLNLPLRQYLGKINARVMTKIVEYDLKTIGDLIRWVDRVDISGEINYGNKSHKWVLDTLNVLAERGPSFLVFGVDTPPKTADELVDLYIGRIESDIHRDVLKKYFEQDLTLDAIGQLMSPPVTRERVRQIIETTFKGDQESWKETALDILNNALDQMEEQNGVILVGTLCSRSGASAVWKVEILARIAGVDISIPRGRREGIATTLESNELSSLASELTEVVDEALEDTDNATELVKRLDEYGFNFGQEVRAILPILVGVSFNGEFAYSSRRKINALYVDSVRKFNRPVSAAELTEHIVKTYPDLSASTHTTIIQLRRSPNIFKTDDHKFVHANDLPVKLETLKSLAVEASKFVPKTGQAVSVRRILNELRSTRNIPETLSPYTLRDAILQLGNFRSWRAGCEIAWICSSTTRTSIPEYIDIVAPTLDQPFQRSELIDDICKISGYLPSSVCLQVGGSEALFLTGHSKHIYKKCVAKDDIEFNNLVDMACKYVPDNGITTSVEMADKAVNMKSYVNEFGAGIIWGLARCNSNIRTKIRGCVAYRSSYASNIWDAFSNDRRWKLGGTFKLDQLRNSIAADFGIRVTGFHLSLLKEAMFTGQVYKSGVDTYVDTTKFSLDI